MKARTDNDGKIHIVCVAAGDTRMTFAVAAQDGVAFPPHTTIELDEERVLNVAKQMGASFGLAVTAIEVVDGRR